MGVNKFSILHTYIYVCALVFYIAHPHICLCISFLYCTPTFIIVHEFSLMYTHVYDCVRVFSIVHLRMKLYERKLGEGEGITWGYIGRSLTVNFLNTNTQYNNTKQTTNASATNTTTTTPTTPHEYQN